MENFTTRQVKCYIIPQVYDHRELSLQLQLDSQTFACIAVPKAVQKPDAESEGEAKDGNKNDGAGMNTLKLTKTEKRAKIKKLRKEAKKQAKEGVQMEEVQKASQAEVLVCCHWDCPCI